MCVVGFCQTVVAEWFCRVGGAFQGFEKAEFDLMFLGTAFCCIEEFLDVCPVVEVTGLITIFTGGFCVVIEA